MIPQSVQKRVTRQLLVEVDAPISITDKAAAREVHNLLAHPMWRDNMRLKSVSSFSRVTAFTRKNERLTFRERLTILLRGQL